MARVVDLWHTKTKKRTTRYGKGSRWQAVWTDAGERQKRSFVSKAAAEEHLVWVTHHQKTGSYVSPERGRVFVADLLEDWLATLAHYKPSTLDTTKSDVSATIKPYWGRKVLADITTADVQKWVTSMDKAGRTVQTIHGRFLTFLEWCISESRITKNPAKGVNLPQGRKREHIFLTPQQVDALADAVEAIYRALIWVLATTGLRMGEVVELRVRDLDVKRRRLRIERSVTFVRGLGAVVGPPKSGKARTVPLTLLALAFLVSQAEGKAPDDLLFTTGRGRQIRTNNFKARYFDAAVRRVNEIAVEDAAGGPVKLPTISADLWVHDLRHTAASWAVQSGASVKSVQRMLGHATAAITLDTYTGLFDQDLDHVAERMEDLILASVKVEGPQKDHRPDG